MSLLTRFHDFLSSSRGGTASSRETESVAETDLSPLVSVIITTYNRPSYLRKAVRSVVTQTYDTIELIIVDDHSETPATEAVSDIDVGALTTVHHIRHEKNQGANAARNTGVEAASGEYISFLDDDDKWVPKKLERQVEVFREADEAVGVVYTGFKSVTETTVEEDIPPEIDQNMTKTLLCRNVVGGMSVIMVRAELARNVPFDDRFPSWADLEWLINLSRQTEFRRIPEPLVVYEYTSHDRLSDDYEKKRVAYELFLDQFAPLATEYGRIFSRKMRAWASFRVGKAAFYTGHYARARHYFFTAVALYPFERSFVKFLLASFGGDPIHWVIKTARQMFH